MLTGNKGEWSEIYTLLKLLGDGKLFAGDENLRKIEEVFYPILKIIRFESGKSSEFEINGDLVLVTGEAAPITISIQKFKEQALFLLNEIKKSKQTFSIPEIEEFISSFNCRTLKAKSNVKTDIQIQIYDSKIQQQVDLGFSVKSQLGGDATLLNAGKTTNFIYKINSLSVDDTIIKTVNDIDSKSKIKDRIEKIKNLGGNLKFENLEQAVFRNNLTLIDSLLPNILSEVLKTFFTSNLNSIKDLTDKITQLNPLNYDVTFAHIFYEYKIKKFLTDVALGMTPSKVWNGIYDATGGYLVVKEDGDVLCYHLYNRNKFEEYLYNNTRLETASSTRHEFGKIYSNNGFLYFKLNLQIRFK